MKFSLVLLAACVPLRTSSTVSTSSSSSPAPSASPAPASALAQTSPSAGESGWFVSQSSATTGPQPAIAATPRGDGWVDAAGTPLPAEYTHGMRTQAASLATIKWGRPVIATCSDRWYLLVARSVDERAGTIEVGRDGNEVCPVNLAIANVRVIVEFKSN